MICASYPLSLLNHTNALVALFTSVIDSQSNPDSNWSLCCLNLWSYYNIKKKNNPQKPLRLFFFFPRTTLYNTLLTPTGRDKDLHFKEKRSAFSSLLNTQTHSNQPCQIQSCPSEVFKVAPKGLTITTTRSTSAPSPHSVCAPSLTRGPGVPLFLFDALLVPAAPPCCCLSWKNKTMPVPDAVFFFKHSWVYRPLQARSRKSGRSQPQWTIRQGMDIITFVSCLA